MVTSYKAKVLKRFPDARVVVMEQDEFGPTRIIIKSNDRSLFIPEWHVSSFREAWRSAWNWCVRHPEAA